MPVCVLNNSHVTVTNSHVTVTNSVRVYLWHRSPSLLYSGVLFAWKYTLQWTSRITLAREDYGEGVREGRREGREKGVGGLG